MKRKEIKMETCIKSLPCQDEIIAWKPTGSYVICSPPVEDTDRDILIYVRSISSFGRDLMNFGWELCGEEYPNQKEYGFIAYRKGIYNLIITGNESFYNLFSQATDLAKKLNLKEKQQRIDLFDYIINCQL